MSKIPKRPPATRFDHYPCPNCRRFTLLYTEKGTVCRLCAEQKDVEFAKEE